MLHKLLFLLFPALSLFIRIDNNLIDWNASRKLEWKDFKGAPDPLSNNAALTNSSITVDFGYNNTGLTHNIKCRFNSSVSWVKIKNDYILNHEQLHFDIAEAHARILHRELNEYRFNSKTVSKDINKMYQEVMDQHVNMQRLYDQQTNHSLDSAQQQQWDNKIVVLLKEYEAFADYH